MQLLFSATNLKTRQTTAVWDTGHTVMVMRMLPDSAFGQCRYTLSASHAIQLATAMVSNI